MVDLARAIVTSTGVLLLVLLPGNASRLPRGQNTAPTVNPGLAEVAVTWQPWAQEVGSLVASDRAGALLKELAIVHAASAPIRGPDGKQTQPEVPLAKRELAAANSVPDR
jgi:hypothetical protein